MKKIYTLSFLLSIFCLNFISAQSGDIQIKYKNNLNSRKNLAKPGTSSNPFHNVNSRHALNKTSSIVYKPYYQSEYWWNVNQWLFVDSTVYSQYNSSGSLLLDSVYYGGSLAGNYDTYTYNPFGYETQWMNYASTGSSWFGDYQENYFYNAQNQDTALIRSQSGGSSWVNFDKNIWKYNGTGQLTNHLVQMWQTGTNSWRNYVETNYFYAGNGQPNKYVDLKWDTISNVWVKTDSVNSINWNSWTGNFNNSKVASYVVDSTSGVHYKDTLTYDLVGNLKSATWYKLQSGSWVYINKLLNNYNYDINNNILMETSKSYGLSTIAIYAPYADSIVYGGYVSYVGVENNLGNADLISVYPNPTAGILHVVADKKTDLKNIQIRDLLGNVVYETLEDVITLNNLPNGVYFVTLTLDKESVTKKFIISK